MSNSAIREACELCIKQMSDAICDNDFGDDIVYLVGCMKTCIERLRAAVVAPRLNCEVGTAEEQLERWKRFCVEHHEPWKHGVIATGACSCPCFRHNDCNSFAWGQMPYESEAKG